MKQNNDKTRVLLHNHGLRYSKPREVILGYFKEKNRHVNAENLYVDLKERGHNLSLSTVYLNLGVLKDAGLVRELRGAAGEAVFDSNLSPHHHLICEQCGSVSDLPEVEIAGQTPTYLLKAHAEGISGWKLKEPNLELKGLCPNCLA